MNGRRIVRLSREGIPLSGCGRPLPLDPRHLGQSWSGEPDRYEGAPYDYTSQ